MISDEILALVKETKTYEIVKVCFNKCMCTVRLRGDHDFLLICGIKIKPDHSDVNVKN